MKWFKFIIYFQLFLTAITCVLNAVTYFTGIHYGSLQDAALVYAYFGIGLKITDVFFALVYVAAGILAIIVRQKLAHFKSKAHLWYIGLLIYLLAANLLYLAIASVLTRLFLLDARTIGNIIGSVLMIVLNWIYFQKRAFLFVRY